MKHTPIDANAAFPKVEKMLYNLAWKFTQQYPKLTFEDARSQAYWGFMEAVRLWNKRGYSEERAKFSTWCYQCTWFNLKNMITERSKDVLEFVDLNEELVGQVIPTAHEVSDMVSDLPGDCQEIVNLIFNMPSSWVGTPMTPRQLLKKVRTFLQRRHRWSEDRVDSACELLEVRFQ
jgi:hypothetical protein